MLAAPPYQAIGLDKPDLGFTLFAVARASYAEHRRLPSQEAYARLSLSLDFRRSVENAQTRCFGLRASWLKVRCFIVP